MGIISGILDLFFPPRCVFCRRILKPGESGMCSRCEENIIGTGSNAAQKGDFYSICVSPLYYEGTVRDAILRFKFKEATGYASTFGRIMAECVKQQLRGQYDMISWVPLSSERLKKRTYDQAMLLAMSTALELDDVAAETLEKFRDIPAQSGIEGAEKRRANVSGVYRVPDPELINGKRILLIDDIVTSGSTLSECARTLKMNGAEEIVCVTLARTRD